MTGDLVTVPCITCGKPVTRPKKRRGRHARFCSAACKAAEKKKTNARWRDAHRKQMRMAFLCEPLISGRIER